uniref:Uncharacterized protein n=1 Tax=Streptomyces sp. F2 TaxID=317660 RepID=V9Z6I6_9ACTN|nr:hypothetical protein [Streptomyces sp. F2]AHE39619.1 Hypothetical protein pFRL4_386 [Streptomyces sp. F2]
MSSNVTNRQQIARALNKATGCGYQRALERVVDAAERKLLPPVLDAAGRAEAVRILTDPAVAARVPSRMLARDYLQALVAELRLLGWGAGHHEPEVDCFGLTVYAGPVAGLSLSVGRADDDADGDEHDPDDPGQSDLTKPLYLTSMCPSGNATVEDFEDGLADCSTEAVRVTARRMDSKLGKTRLHRVRGTEEHSTASCPICADRYPEHHLLKNSPSAIPVCPACIFDGDQAYRTDLPYLAVQLDRLLHDDLAAPAGWDAVAAVLALTCGPNLGTRLDRELKERGGWPIVMERWGEPLERSWIWLPPPAHRHEAFKHLGAGATLAALVDAVDRHDPTARAAAKALCRESGVRWRDALWPAAIAYAVAFTTQSHERDRHRTPFHVVHSLSDGLGQTMKPFAVTGDASNVEYGLEALLKYQLFPMLLGYSLDEEPDDPRRRYGAQPDDDRPARSRADARLTHGIDRANQVAVVLGKIPFTPAGVPVWDGAAVAGADAQGLGSTAPANDLCRAIRDEARQQAAEALYDLDGCDAVDADQAWARSGWWIPSDHAPHAVRQAQQFLPVKTRVHALWLGPAAQLPEPVQICVDITSVNAHSTGPRDVPWLQVSDGRSVFGLTLSDVALIRRAEPGEELTEVWPSDHPSNRGDDAPATETSPATSDESLPTLDELSLLTNQFLHLAGHRLGEGWKSVDEKAYAAHQRLEKALEAEYTGFAATRVKVWINLFDTAHPCPSGQAQALPAYALTGKPYEVAFDVHAHDPSCGCGQEYGFGDFSDRVCQLLIVLCLYGGLIEAHPMIEIATATDDPDEHEAVLRDITWEVDGPDSYDFREIQRRVIRDITDPESSLNTDTNPTYIPPHMAADGWYLPEGGTSMMFHGRRHEDDTD